MRPITEWPGLGLAAPAKCHRPFLGLDRKGIPQMIGNPQLDRPLPGRVGEFDHKGAIDPATDRHDTGGRAGGAR